MTTVAASGAARSLSCQTSPASPARRAYEPTTVTVSSAVDQHAVDPDVDVVETVAQHRDGDGCRQQHADQVAAEEQGYRSPRVPARSPARAGRAAVS